MKIDLLLMQLAVIFLPGIIWARLDARYALRSPPTDTEFALRAFMFGLASYCVTYILYSLVGLPFTIVNISEVSEKPVLSAAVIHEIGAAIAVGTALSILWIYASTYKWLTRFLKLIRATKMYGDEDVWDFTFNSPRAEVEYIHFRDFANSLTYSGWVNTFSETEKLRELVLRDVQVFNFDGEKLFETPLIYLARAPENIHIEFPYRPSPAPGAQP